MIQILNVIKKLLVCLLYVLLKEIRMGKLVRDLIPRIALDRKFKVIEDKDEYRKVLLDKLVEEAVEVKESNADAEELADVMEVFEAIVHEFQHDIRHIRAEQEDKRKRRGGFREGIFLLDK